MQKDNYQTPMSDKYISLEECQENKELMELLNQVESSQIIEDFNNYIAIAEDEGIVGKDKFVSFVMDSYMEESEWDGLQKEHADYEGIISKAVGIMYETKLPKVKKKKTYKP
jgi:hypothetical protein